MKFDDLWPRHIPKGLTLSREAYRSVKRRARVTRRRDPGYYGAAKKYTRLYLLIALPAFAICVYLGRSWVTYLLTLASIAYAMCIWQRTYVPYIRRALCEAGHEVCIDCGYLLRGLPDDVKKCPECGAVRVDEHSERARLREADEALLCKPRRAARPETWTAASQE